MGMKSCRCPDADRQNIKLLILVKNWAEYLTLMVQTKNSYKQFPEPDNVTMTILSQKNSFWWKGVAKWFCCLFCIHIQRKGAQPPLLSRVALSQAWWWLLLWHWYCWHLYSCGLQWCHWSGKVFIFKLERSTVTIKTPQEKNKAVQDPRLKSNFALWWLGIGCLVSTSFLGQPFSHILSKTS